MSNEKMDQKENNEDSDDIILTENECDLYDLFINEYNDLFENILNLKGKNIYAIIKRNVFLLLGKTEFNKYSKASLKKVYNKIKEEYFKPDNIVIKNLENNLDSIGVRDLPLLNIDSIFAHCNKCYECTHMCGEPLYNYKYYDLIICIKCKMIYKKNMIRLFCTSCDEEYYSYIVSDTNYKDDFFPATWDKYHCFTFNYEQMPCPECLAPLYYSEVQNLLKCFDCNWILNPNNINWICQVCGKEFTSGVKEFVKYENKPEINCIKYGLINRIKAKPFTCQCCGINPLNTTFFHVGCGGNYYISYLQTKVVIICDKCKTIQKPEDIQWGCGNCKNSFNCDKIIILENKVENNYKKSVLQTRSNFFFKDRANISIKNSFIKKDKENRVSSSERCLTAKKAQNFKANEKIKELKNQKMKLNQRRNTEKNLKEFEEKNNIRRNLDNCLKAIDTTIGNTNDSNLLKNINLKRKQNLSNSSLEFYVLEKDKIENEKEKEKEKDVTKIDDNNILQKEKVDSDKEKEIIDKEKEKINQKDKIKKKNTNNKPKDKKLKKLKKIKEKKILENNKDKDNKDNKDDKDIEDKDNEKLINEEKGAKIENIKTIERNEIKEDKEKNNKIVENAKKKYNNLAKYNRRKNNINYILDKTNLKGQSQKKSKNIRLNVNLNININNIMDKKHNNNSIHSIKQVTSYKNIPTKNICYLEPDENFNPDEFKIVEKIGYGSFGKIYNVRWIRNNKNYAMKIINLRYLDNIEDTQKKLQIVQDFLKKTHCPGVIKIFGSLYEKIAVEDYKYYILMELAQTDWEEEIKYRNKHNLYYTEEEIFNMIQQLVRCYSLLQKNNVSHRDVKPQNILILNGMYKVCDFGEARTISGKNGYIHQPIRGSELYMSPILFDALNSHRIDVLHNSYKSDVFSLGMCLFLAATLSFNSLYEIREEKNMKVIRKILEKYLIPHYSSYLVDILFQMLQVDEDMRPNFIELEKLLFYS
jgi:hypothetical protein